MTHSGDREPRKPTFIEAEIRDGSGWAEVLICNISERGMMLRGEHLPEEGSDVEVRGPAFVVVGQVRWRCGNRCGLRLREATDIQMISGEVDAPIGDRFVLGKVAQKLAWVKNQANLTPAFRQARRLIEFVLVVLACVALGAVAVGSIASILSHPLRRTSFQIDSSRN